MGSAKILVTTLFSVHPLYFKGINTCGVFFIAQNQSQSFCPATAMARLEQAIKNIVDMFVEYTDGDGKLTKRSSRSCWRKKLKTLRLK